MSIIAFIFAIMIPALLGWALGFTININKYTMSVILLMPLVVILALYLNTLGIERFVVVLIGGIGYVAFCGGFIIGIINRIKC